MKRPLRVSLIQSPAWSLDEHEQAWADLLTRVDEAGEAGTDLIVTPEASYPAYLLPGRAAYEERRPLPDATVEAALGALAATHRCHIVAGLVQRAGDALANRAVLFGPDGRVVGRYQKSFLWHLDGGVFQPGREFPSFPLPLGGGEEPVGLGMYICADGRLPEIPRALAAAGARILAVPTAWVATGDDPQHLHNAQADYLSQARAAENGAWVLVADKVGVEGDTLVYAGRSGIIAPDGTWLVQAPSHEAGTVTATIDLAAGDEGPPVAPRPELYAGARTAAETSPAARHSREPLVVADATGRVGAQALPAAPSAVELMERLREAARAQARQGTQVLVLPDLAGEDPRAVTADELLPALGALTAETGLLITVVLAERTPGATYKTCYAVGPGGVRAAHRQTHLRPAELAAGFRPGDQPCPRVPSAAGTVGLLAGSEGLVPELARAHRLAGAEILAWSAGALPGPLRELTRSRANEQRMYVVAAGDGARCAAYIADPAGTVVQESLPGRPMHISADINRALTRWHRMAPGTDPFAAFRPVAPLGPVAPFGAL